MSPSFIQFRKNLHAIIFDCCLTLINEKCHDFKSVKVTNNVYRQHANTKTPVVLMINKPCIFTYIHKLDEREKVSTV